MGLAVKLWGLMIHLPWHVKIRSEVTFKVWSMGIRMNKLWSWRLRTKIWSMGRARRSKIWSMGVRRTKI